MKNAAIMTRIEHREGSNVRGQFQETPASISPDASGQGIIPAFAAESAFLSFILSSILTRHSSGLSNLLREASQQR